MKMRFRNLLFVGALAAAISGWAEAPHLGYVFPAGGERGTTFEVTVGGQFLESADEIVVTGDGVEARVINYRKILTRREIRQAKRRIRTFEAKMEDASERKRERMRKQVEKNEALLAMQDPDRLQKKLPKDKAAEEMKRQLNPQLSERLVLEVTIAADALDGERELRIQTPGGVSNPIFFHVGNLNEASELEPNDDHHAVDLQEVELPVLINGQIMPGDIDHFRFEAKKGDQLVVDVSARKLIPYLADAVPGWFQATLALFDEEGNEVAFADDYKFNPDPVLFYDVPEDGRYILEIRDSIYRGREDFVYRVSVGKLPFITSIFPLGGQKGSSVEIALRGRNLPRESISGQLAESDVRVKQLSVKKGGIRSNPVSFVVGDTPELLEVEPNEKVGALQQLKLPVVVNGRIQQAGDRDVFSFTGRKGDSVSLEVHARRLNSPLDSVIRLYDAQWNELGSNDDFVDKTAGLMTHHADSYLFKKLPADGTYYVVLADTQHHGGEEYAYRLRIAASQPDFALRLHPSGVNIAPGGSATFTAHALRKDGFDGEIKILADELSSGFVMSKAVIPAGVDRVRFTITAPERSVGAGIKPRLSGMARIQGETVVREALAVDDQMQAFLYRHLVPADELILVEAEEPPLIFEANLPSSGVVELPLGEEVSIPIDVYWNRRYFNSVKLMLDSPPEGISLVKGDIESGVGWGKIVLKATAPLKPGFMDNLILKAELIKGKKKTVCSSPALPIRVVEGSK
ncbi:hypothetical protein ACFLQY_00765 [Verrucomicrobiota bacterium]